MNIKRKVTIKYLVFFSHISAKTLSKDMTYGSQHQKNVKLKPMF